MATGASTANLAVVLIDARQGVVTQTKRHSFIASLLGIPRLVIAVNKMDLVGYSKAVFDRIVAEYRDCATRLGVLDLKFIPISALKGDNVVERSRHMPYYQGESLLEYLEHVYIGSDRNLVDFRLPVQYVARSGLDHRRFAGQIASGVVKVGDEVWVLPAGRTSRVRSIWSDGGEHDHAFAPMSVAIALEDEIDISRGDLLVHPRNLPRVQGTFEAMVVWLAEEPMRLGRTYVIKHTTRTTNATVQEVEYRVDVTTLSRTPAAPLQLNEIGRVVLQATQKLFLDPYAKNRLTGSLILVDPVTNNTVGAGMVIDRVPEEQLRVPLAAGAPPRSENIRRERSGVSAPERGRLLRQRAVTVWLTGLPGSGKSSIGREVERQLFAAGRHACVLDGDTLRFGLNRDLAFTAADRTENVRRIAEVARLFNEAGTIVLVPVISPFRADRDRARAIIGDERFCEIYVSTPLEVCEARDPKGLYRRARAGEITDFTGVSSPYEPPEWPFLELTTAGRTLEACVAEVMARLHPLIRVRVPA